MGEFTVAPVKAAVSMDQFSCLDIRVGTIQAVDDVAGSKKLVRLTVSFGDHRRSVLAGLKQEREDPGVLKGTQGLFLVSRFRHSLTISPALHAAGFVPSPPNTPGILSSKRLASDTDDSPRLSSYVGNTTLVNLEPKRMAGEVSEGMLLDIGYADGLTPVMAVPENAVPDGARVG